MNWPWLITGAALAGVGGYFSTRYAWWRRTVPWTRPRVLMYHMISPPRPGARFNGMRVSPEQFGRQLAWLRRHQFTFATMADLAAGRAGERAVVLTFDDGYEDNLLNALPLLREHGARATLYLVGDRQADWSAKKKAHHASGELGREPKLTDPQVRELLDSGLIELGAHTLTHANLAKLDADQKRAEIAGSKHELERKFGVPVLTFAYPFGIWDEADRVNVRDAGFTTAVTTEPGIDGWPLPDPLAIRRVKVSGKEGMRSFVLRMRAGQRGAWK